MGRARNYSKCQGFYMERKVSTVTCTSLRSSSSQSYIFFHIFHIFLHISYIFGLGYGNPARVVRSNQQKHIIYTTSNSGTFLLIAACHLSRVSVAQGTYSHIFLHNFHAYFFKIFLHIFLIFPH